MKIYSVFSIFLLYFMISCSTKKTTEFLVGTYTDSAAQGINVVNFYPTSKALFIKNVITGVENPSFVIANKSKSIIVTVEEIASEKGGKITSFFYDKKTKKHTKLNSLFTNGNHPCTVAFSPDERFVLVGNYSGGSLTVFPIDKKGKLSENINFIQYEGQSFNKERQEKPHVHCIVVHPKENIIAVADLGRDIIELIPFDINSKSFLMNEKGLSTKVKLGSGPRHLVWNKAGNLLFVTYELTNEVAVFQYNNGKLAHLQDVPLTEQTTSGSTAELRLSKDEQFLYASVRGLDNHIVVMKISKENLLAKIQTIATERTPRNFIISENQKSILVASQGSNSISVFDRNEKTGLLTKTAISVSINKPVYLFPF